MTTNFLSFDIEDWFQVPFVENEVSRSDWDTSPSVVADGVAKILALLKRHDIQATFFVVGWIADRYPEMVKRIAGDGHEIGAHSFAHRPLDRMSPSEVEADTARNVEAIYQACGISPKGYRAPLGSIGDRNPWAIDVLKRSGFVYDSSIYPKTPLVYSGMKSVQIAPHEIRPGFWEVPMSVERMFPLSGGFYLRLSPLSIFRALLRSKNRRSEGFVLYYHPWEFSTTYPRPIRHPIKRFIQYYNLPSIEKKLDVLMSEFSFRPLIDAIPRVP